MEGIDSNLIKLPEEYATSYGYYQIRAWSSEDKTEALNMWRKLNYCMCPAAMLGESGAIVLRFPCDCAKFCEVEPNSIEYRMRSH